MMLAFLLFLVVYSSPCIADHADKINKTALLLSQQGLTTCSEKENEMAEMNVSEETWKDIAGYEGIYQVSDKGRVRGVDRRMAVNRNRPGTQFFRGRNLMPSQDRGGYHRVSLNRSGQIEQRSISRLVVAAFCGDIEDQLEVNHKDGNKANNQLENLELVTPSENCRHRDANGLRDAARGSGHGQAKLDEQIVSRIIGELNLFDGKVLADKYGVSTSTISLIRRGKIWKHVTEGYTA